MVEEQRSRQELLATVLSIDPEGWAASPLQFVCCRAEDMVGVSGAAVSLGAPTGNDDGHGRALGAVSGEQARRLAELQLTVGEGPCLDVYRDGAPVLVPELAGSDRWPVFGPAARELGVAAVFSFPLQIGAARMGSLDLHRETPGRLGPEQYATALLITELATYAVVAELENRPADDVGWLADLHVEVHQATGVLQSALGISTEHAMLRLRGAAYARGEPLIEVARRIVRDRELPEGLDSDA